MKVARARHRLGHNPPNYDGLTVMELEFDLAEGTLKALVTGSAGHLGEGLVRTLRGLGHEVIGIDVLESPFTTHVGSILDRSLVKRCMEGVEVVFHAATLHKPHVATHKRQEFVDVNISGTLNLLEGAVSAGVGCFVYTSTTSVFGDALAPPLEAPAAWITEEVAPVLKNIYGATKAAAEDLCQLFHRNQGLACMVLRTSRFFPEEDDNREVREAYSEENLKGQRIPAPAGGHRRCGERSYSRGGARDGAWLSEIYHQRHHALLPGRSATPARRCSRRGG